MGPLEDEWQVFLKTVGFCFNFHDYERQSIFRGVWFFFESHSINEGFFFGGGIVDFQHPDKEMWRKKCIFLVLSGTVKLKVEGFFIPKEISCQLFPGEKRGIGAESGIP